MPFKLSAELASSLCCLELVPTYLARTVPLCFALSAGCATLETVVPRGRCMLLLTIMVFALAAWEKLSYAEIAPRCAELFEGTAPKFFPHIGCIHRGLSSIARLRKVLQLLMQPALSTAQTSRADLGRLG